MIHSYMDWASALQSGKSIVDAMTIFDYKAFEQNFAALMEEFKKTAEEDPPSAAVKEEEAGEEVGDKCRSAASAKAQPGAKAAAKVDSIHPMPFVQKTLTMPGVDQYVKLITEVVKQRLLRTADALD